MVAGIRFRGRIQFPVYYKAKPRTGSGAVIHRNSCVDFGAIYIVCLCVLFNFLTFFLFYFLLSLCFVPYLFTSLLVDFLTYLSTSSRIDAFRLQAGGCRRRPNLTFVWGREGVILCCSIFCYGCTFAFVMFVSNSSVVSREIGCMEERLRYGLFCVGWDVKP